MKIALFKSFIKVYYVYLTSIASSVHAYSWDSQWVEVNDSPTPATAVSAYNNVSIIHPYQILWTEIHETVWPACMCIAWLPLFTAIH